MGARKNTHPGLYQRGRYWWLSRDPVEGRPISTRCTSLKAAREFQVERERLGANPAYAASKAARLGEWCQGYLEMRVRSGTKPVTVKFISEKLGHWLRIFGADCPLSTFADVKVWDGYYRQRADEGASNHTVTKETQKMRLVLASAKRAGYFAGEISELKPEGLTTSYTPRTRALSVDEVRAFIPKLKGKPLTMACLSIATGARLSEAQNMDPTDIDVELCVVNIRGTKTKGSDRVVPILAPFAGLLLKALPGMPVGPLNNLRRDLHAACERAGIASAGMNDFRRTHATILAELGAAQDHTSDLLGHATTAMVKRVYRQPRALALKALIERSTGVVDIIAEGVELPEVTHSKCTESVSVCEGAATGLGFLSRRSHVQIVSGAPRKAQVPGTARPDCSRYVAVPARLALALTAHKLGLLPERRAS